MNAPAGESINLINRIRINQQLTDLQHRVDAVTGSVFQTCQRQQGPGLYLRVVICLPENWMRGLNRSLSIQTNAMAVLPQ